MMIPLNEILVHANDFMFFQVLGKFGDKVWYHGYHTIWTRRKGTGRPAMSRPTRPEDPGQEAHY
jgi:hypothetical protein